MNSELKYWVWLSSLAKISPRKRIRLLEHFHDPAFIWEASEAELRSLSFCTPGIVGCILDREARKEANIIIDRVRKCDADIITINDSAYPQALRQTADPPVVLYLRGKLVKSSLCVAVVGSRRATPYGQEMARRLSQELARHGVTVVSGMARGIDSKAHLGSLEAGGRTVAVLGCGVDIVYPPENNELMERIIKSGTVISEYPPGTAPIPFNFPARNRIISGLSQGVVIVEASEKSGSLITADFALEQGRDVFAVPGNINSGNSKGTNRLIREGAKIITGAGDILEELKIDHSGSADFCGGMNLYETKLGRAQICTESDIVQLGADEKTIAQRLLNGPAHLDVIARDCGISVQLASSLLVMLELSGFVEQLPGKFFKLVQ